MLAKELGKSQEEIIKTMSPDEFKQWVAYFSLQNGEYKEKMEEELSKEKSAEMTDEDKDNALRELFLGLQNNGTNR